MRRSSQRRSKSGKLCSGQRRAIVNDPVDCGSYNWFAESGPVGELRAGTLPSRLPRSWDAAGGVADAMRRIEAREAHCRRAPPHWQYAGELLLRAVSLDFASQRRDLAVKIEKSRDRFRRPPSEPAFATDPKNALVATRPRFLSARLRRRPRDEPVQGRVAWPLVEGRRAAQNRRHRCDRLARAYERSRWDAMTWLKAH